MGNGVVIWYKEILPDGPPGPSFLCVEGGAGVWKSDADRLAAEKRIRQELVSEIRAVCGKCPKLMEIPWYRAEVLRREKSRLKKAGRNVIK